MVTQTQTHTYVTLEVSETTYNEIKKKLEEAGYTHCFMVEKPPAHGSSVISTANPIIIDMHGIALKGMTSLASIFSSQKDNNNEEEILPTVCPHFWEYNQTWYHCRLCGETRKKI